MGGEADLNSDCNIVNRCCFGLIRYPRNVQCYSTSHFVVRHENSDPTGMVTALAAGTGVRQTEGAFVAALEGTVHADSVAAQ